MKLQCDQSERLFEPGKLYFTRGVIGTCDIVRMAECLIRHMKGDWGCIDAEDRSLNDEAVKVGNRILSAYAIDDAKPSEGHGENTLWIITEADRSSTTLLLPDEY